MIDLTQELDSYFADPANDDKRGDEQFAHVSDLSFCKRKTWARRNGYAMELPDTRTRLKWALGVATEDALLKAFSKQLAGQGWLLRRDVRIALSISGDGTLEGRELLLGEQPNPIEVVGHLDALLVHEAEPPIVVECKSTSFLRGRSPERPSEWYVIQAAAYALAKRAPRFAIFILDRESGRTAEFWMNTANHADEISDLVMQTLLLTGKDSPQPPAAPTFGWECKYCPLVSCERKKVSA